MEHSLDEYLRLRDREQALRQEWLEVSAQVRKLWLELDGAPPPHGWIPGAVPTTISG